MTRGIRYILLRLLWAYRMGIRPLLGPSCRFTPSCSAYAEEALKKKPLLTALWLIIKRLLRCGPWCKGGYDPVP